MHFLTFGGLVKILDHLRNISNVFPYVLWFGKDIGIFTLFRIKVCLPEKYRNFQVHSLPISF